MRTLKMASILRLAFNELGYTDQVYIENNINSIITKLAAKKDEQWHKLKTEWVFTHSETGNKVKYTSLPLEQQKKIRAQYLQIKKEKKEQNSAKKEQPKSPLTPEIKEERFKEDKKGQEFLKNEEQREEQVEEVKEEVKSDGFFKKALKSITNADSYSDFGKAFKNKDKEGMKKAVPGMVGGLFKTLAASAVVIGGGGFVGSAGVLTAAKASIASAASSFSVGSAIGSIGSTLWTGIASTASMAFFGALGQKFGLQQAIQSGVDKIPTKKKQAKKKEENGDVDKMMEKFVKETQNNFIKELDKLKDVDHLKKVIKEI